jgi:hypothetical protein
MTEEEKAALEAAGGVVIEQTIVDPIAVKDAEIKKLTEDLENYKAVALKRLGKLPGDADFLANGDEDKGELSVAEQVLIILKEKEIEAANKAKEDETRKLVRENTELKLALKNRPGDSIGGESGAGGEVKDNVFTAEQISAMKSRAKRLGVDEDKFVEKAKANFISRK